MFDRFRAAFPPVEGGATHPFDSTPLAGFPGFAELAAECGGTTFGGGLVRVHSAASARRVDPLIAEGFPEFPERFRAIAQDWMGRQFAVGSLPDSRYHGRLLLFEPATGEAFEIDADVSALFNSEMVSDPVTYLAADLFEEWRRAGGELGGPDEVVGFRVPLFLGGDGAVENLEVVDLEVYWSLLGQMRAGGALA